MLGVSLPSRAEKAALKEVDHAALLAEAYYLGPPSFDTAGVDLRDVAVVAMCRMAYPETIDPHCEAVSFYIQAVCDDLDELRNHD
jgi:hypothetical protein